MTAMTEIFPDSDFSIQGIIWLQGAWLGRAGEEDAAIWKNSTAIWSNE